jgi:hypothetical protein
LSWDKVERTAAAVRLGDELSVVSQGFDVVIEAPESAGLAILAVSMGALALLRRRKSIAF